LALEPTSYIQNLNFIAHNSNDAANLVVRTTSRPKTFCSAHYKPSRIIRVFSHHNEKIISYPYCYLDSAKMKSNMLARQYRTSLLLDIKA